MKISEINRSMSNISIEAKVIDISEPREVQTRYGKKNVADATLEDESGQISLTLWEEKITSISVGDNIKVAGAYVTSFKDKMQLNVPRNGIIEVVK
jgi:ssDNA-binding replication factor A large subunit